MFRKYLVYLDCGDFVTKVAVAALSEDDAIAYCDGNGEVIAVKDVTDKYMIDAERVSKALEDGGFGEYEIDFIRRALVDSGIIE